MSLRLRLTLSYAGLVATIVVVFGAVLYTTMEQTLEAEQDRRLEIRASQVQLTIWPGTQSLTPEDLTSARLDLSPLADLDAPGIYVQVLDRDQQVIGTSENLRGAALPSDPTSIAGVFEGKRVLGDVIVGEGRRIRVLSVPIVTEGKVVGILQVGQSRQPLQATMANLRRLLLLLGATAVLAAGTISWFVAWHGLNTLRRISAQAATIAARRDFSRRLELGDRGDEVGQLARTIDRLLATVEDTLQKHREFVADTSHELRNPLLAIRTNLELLDRVTDPAGRTECLLEARQQAERMGRLVADLLLLAQVEAGQILERRPVALSPLAAGVVRQAEQRAAGQRLRLEPAEDVEVLGDERRLTQVLTNLVDNALRHTPPAGTVTLSVVRQDGWARLTVADTGEGIAPSDLPHIFDRFYRANKGSAMKGRQAAGSIGLGLAIVKHLTEAHGGRVTAESKLGFGSRFDVWLPLNEGTSKRASDGRAPAL